MSEVAEQDSEFAKTDPSDPVIGPSKPRLIGILGPGAPVTGASDDDFRWHLHLFPGRRSSRVRPSVADAFYLPADVRDAGDQRAIGPHHPAMVSPATFVGIIRPGWPTAASRFCSLPTSSTSELISAQRAMW